MTKIFFLSYADFCLCLNTPCMYWILYWIMPTRHVHASVCTSFSASVINIKYSIGYSSLNLSRTSVHPRWSHWFWLLVVQQGRHSLALTGFIWAQKEEVLGLLWSGKPWECGTGCRLLLICWEVTFCADVALFFRLKQLWLHLIWFWEQTLLVMKWNMFSSSANLQLALYFNVFSYIKGLLSFIVKAISILAFKSRMFTDFKDFQGHEME